MVGSYFFCRALTRPLICFPDNDMLACFSPVASFALHPLLCLPFSLLLFSFGASRTTSSRCRRPRGSTLCSAWGPTWRSSSPGSTSGEAARGVMWCLEGHGDFCWAFGATLWLCDEHGKARWMSFGIGRQPYDIGRPVATWWARSSARLRRGLSWCASNCC